MITDTRGAEDGRDSGRGDERCRGGVWEGGLLSRYMVCFESPMKIPPDSKVVIPVNVKTY